MAVPKSLVEKVQKLLALSTSSNVNEAAVAWQKAQQLLLEHNLTLEELEPKARKKHDFIMEQVEMGSSRTWRSTLLRLVCEACLCTSVVVRSTPKAYIIGEKHNIDVATFMFKSIEGQLEHFASLEYIKARRETLASGASWKKSFYYGCIETLGKRLTPPQQEDAVTALVVYVRDELEEKKRELFEVLYKSRAVKFYLNTGYGAGLKAGHRVEINKSIQGEAQ